MAAAAAASWRPRVSRTVDPRPARRSGPCPTGTGSGSNRRPAVSRGHCLPWGQVPCGTPRNGPLGPGSHALEARTKIRPGFGLSAGCPSQVAAAREARGRDGEALGWRSGAPGRAAPDDPGDIGRSRQRPDDPGRAATPAARARRCRPSAAGRRAARPPGRRGRPAARRAARSAPASAVASARRREGRPTGRGSQPGGVSRGARARRCRSTVAGRRGGRRPGTRGSPAA